MIELNLQRTWSEIFEHLNNNPNPLRITELVNRFPPCCWTFKFTFDGLGRTTVKIDCDATVSDEDALILLDGSLEEVFFADAFHLRQMGKYFTGNTTELLKNPPALNLMRLRHSDLKADFLLILEGFWQSDSVPSEIQQDSTVRSCFLENTWLGSSDFVESEYYIRWLVFGNEQLIRPESRYKIKLGATDSFTTQVNLSDTNGNHIGQANFYTSPSLKDDEIYTMSGPLAPKQKNWLTSDTESAHWIVEISSESLRQPAIQLDHTSELINKLIDSVGSARILVTESNCFKDYEQKIQWKRQIRAADSLKQRQERARKGDRIIFNDKPVMLVPSNENEVLVLLAKLEALDALPFHEFCLWEYTARTGIDAIASYQIREVDVQSMFVAIEVEHYFESFFDHNHPHNQVDLVICWDFRHSRSAANLRKRNEWLFEYQNDESFFVVVLSYIPNLRIERS